MSAVVIPGPDPAAPLVLPLREALARHGAAWEALSDAAEEPNPFLSPVMLRAAPGRVEPDDWTAVLVPDPDGRGLQAAAVVRRGRALPVLAPPTVDHFWSGNGPLGVPLRRPAVQAGRLLDALAACGDVARFTHLPLDGPFGRGLEAAAAARGLALVVLDEHRRAAFEPTGPEEGRWGPGLQGKRRKELGRLFRRLQEEGCVHDAATTPEAVAAALPGFLALEDAGWKGRAGTSLAADADHRAFATDLVLGHAARGRARLDRLLVGGAPVAALVTLTAGDHAVLWKIAHDEAHAARSPGVQLVRLLSEALAAEGAVRSVDSLAVPDHPMIDRLWAGRIRIGTVVVALRPDANGRARRAAEMHAARRRMGRLARDMAARLKRDAA